MSDQEFWCSTLRKLAVLIEYEARQRQAAEQPSAQGVDWHELERMQ